MNIIKKVLTLINRTKKNSRSIDYIVIHYTANNGDTAIGNANYFKNTYRGASAHYFVDENEICQCVEDSDIAWHCGSETGKYYNGCRNSNSIGIELCSRKDANGEYYFKDETVNNAIELTKMLMQKYNIDVNHIVKHYDVTHKVCPEPFVRNESLWIDFKNKLIEEEDEMSQIINEIANKAETTPEFVIDTLAGLVKMRGAYRELPHKSLINEIEEAKEKGITDGSRMGDIATRGEVAVMIKRATK